MKRFLLPLLLTLTPLTADMKPAIAEILKATEDFLETLEDERRNKASIALVDKEREYWHYTPRERRGLSLKAMNDTQKNAAVGIVTAILSEKGAYQSAQVILLEGVLAVMEKNPEFRDIENYYVSIFGTPGNKKGWGVRFEGHHLSINLTVVNGDRVSVTPNFVGANPAEVPAGEHKGMRPLSSEEDLARALMLSLVDSGKKEVIFSTEPPREILTGEERSVKPLKTVGVQLEDLSESQTEALFELIAAFTGRFHGDIANDELAAIRKAGKIHFGWAGSAEAGKAYYYRIQGPSFLIETANTQNDANHIHTVWRDFDGDFGRDLLKEHLEHSH